jgi:hypothetical protein
VKVIEEASEKGSWHKPLLPSRGFKASQVVMQRGRSEIHSLHLGGKYRMESCLRKWTLEPR